MAAFWTLAGLALLVLSSRALVWGAVELAQARSRAYDCLEEQLSGLMERAENGEELRYLGTPAHFIRDADFGERYAGAV